MLGRLAYLYYYRPRGFSERVLRQGVLRTLRARQGRQDVKVETQRFLKAESSVEGRGPQLEVPAVYVTGRTTVDLLVVSVSSLYAVATPSRVTVVSDGTLTNESCRDLERKFPGLRCVQPSALERAIESTLPRDRFPALRGLRDTFVLARKLIDVHFAEPNWFVFVDADTVFWKCPNEILEWGRNPSESWFLADTKEVYGVRPEELWRLAGKAAAGPVNSGLFGIDGGAVDWEFMESVARDLNLVEKRTHHTEQAIYAAVFAKLGARMLPSDTYIVSPTHEQADRQAGTFHHYVADCRYLFYAGNWRRFLTQEKQKAR
jgi:hypothetical protein